MRVSTGTDLTTWELAEVQRSRAEASGMRAAKRTAASIVARYADPPADTAYDLEYAYHLLGAVRGQTLLEIGCGDGRDTTLLAGKGARVYALDLSPELLEIGAGRITADGHADAVTFLCGSAHAVPLPDESVDIVFGNAILHHLDLVRARDEVVRVLRPGGRAIFKEPIRYSRLLRAVRPLIPYRQPNLSPYERPLYRSEIDRFSEPFARGRSRQFRLPLIGLARALRATRSVQERIPALDARLLGRHPWLRAYAGVLVFELFKPHAAAAPRAESRC